MSVYKKLDLGLTAPFIEKMKNYSGSSGQVEKYEYKQIHKGRIYDGLSHAVIPHDDFREIPFLYDLITQHSADAKFWKLVPNYLIEWHVDNGRGMVITIPIEDVSDRITVFQTTEQALPACLQNYAVDPNPVGYSRSGLVEKVDYQVGYGFALNSKILHEVMNLKTVNSYIINLSFSMSYDELLDYCRDRITES